MKKMAQSSLDKIVGYHYTNPDNYIAMKTGSDYTSIETGKPCKGLHPMHRFVRYGWTRGLPDDAHSGVIEGLLEPEPKEWTDNPEFPGLWRYLLHDLCRRNEIVLLKFDILPSDQAYVVDRSHVEHELYREAKGLGKSTINTMTEACRKYYDSRVPVFDYSGEYSVPQLAIWSAIDFERLEVVWVRKSQEFWEESKRYDKW